MRRGYGDKDFLLLSVYYVGSVKYQVSTRVERVARHLCHAEVTFRCPSPPHSDSWLSVCRDYTPTLPASQRVAVLCVVSVSRCSTQLLSVPVKRGCRAPILCLGFCVAYFKEVLVSRGCVHVGWKYNYQSQVAKWVWYINTSFSVYSVGIKFWAGENNKSNLYFIFTMKQNEKKNTKQMAFTFQTK